MTSDFTIDLQHLGRQRFVSSHVFMTDEGPVLLDTGPGSTIERLESELGRNGFRLGDLYAIVLSHAHLDHAGATGLVIQANPRAKVYAHHLAARHLIDPTKLIASATRVFGDNMERYWGRFLAVPAAQVVTLEGGEVLTLGNRTFEAIYTPGHAVHHLAYYERAERTVYAGDVGGIRVPSLPVVVPVTPPPDYDLELWLRSIEIVRGLGATRLFRTHFGFLDDVDAQLNALVAGLHAWTDQVVELYRQDLPEPERADRFDAFVRTWLADRAEPDEISRFAEFSDFRANYYGIARYVAKRG
ncbi:MAG: MBL fold metallo-hydrolase [Gemmatimonadales bacterium]|nr:MBL fold metallo-hydrolase [Gemmatimonadales bacterium]